MFTIKVATVHQLESVLQHNFSELNIKSEPVAEDLVDWSVQALKSGQQERVDYSTKHLVYHCEFCPSVFLTSYHLEQHNLQHLRVNLSVPHMYQCDHCSVIFTHKSALAKHIKVKHRRILHKNFTKRMHECKICKKTFKYKAWHEHMQNVHNGVKSQCHICSQMFKCKRNLSNHIKYKHSDRKAEWMMKKKLNMRRFSNQPVQCTQCSKMLRNVYCLKHHIINIHSSNGKQFICDICGSVLRCLSYLNVHKKRVHYNDGKQHACDICQKRFKSPRYVKVHKKNSHKI